jgi:ribosomal protein S18 acetylase RimI-like enzyme
LSAWKLRNGTAADITSVLALWRAAESRPSQTDSEHALELLLARDPEALLVTELDDEIVGSLIAGWDGWRGSLYRLAVHPQSRRRGIATSLVRAGERRLEKLGAVRMTAIVATDEDAAMALWRAVGYTLQPERSRFVLMLTAPSAR